MAENKGHFYQSAEESVVEQQESHLDPVEVTKEVVEDEQASEEPNAETTKS